MKLESTKIRFAIYEVWMVVGTFQYNSTNGGADKHLTTWDSLENWIIGYCNPQKPNLTILVPTEERLMSYSIGHFCLVML